MGIGEAKDDSKLIDRAIEDLSLISGQKAVKTNAKKAISGFKIRAGMPLGVKVTLRNKIIEFLRLLISEKDANTFYEIIIYMLSKNKKVNQLILYYRTKV